ncbi:hypothetical protein RJE46_17585 [Cedecea neteri]|uniref:hypothetical protein n=1 Tax=Cedecea neteri TaxID=158822 RepID=UPI002892CC3C|nr:hypothetical protein [Cedecea neteri]WNJ78417.1 hypothetical protein RJE46_17585 [Cedecea neteri]
MFIPSPFPERKKTKAMGNIVYSLSLPAEEENKSYRKHCLFPLPSRRGRKQKLWGTLFILSPFPQRKKTKAMGNIVYSLSLPGEGENKSYGEHCLFPLPFRERVRVRVKIRSKAQFQLKSPSFSLRLASPGL